MREIRCGEPDCPEVASTESIVEMANITGGMLAGLVPRSRTYRCPSGHVTAHRTFLGRLRDFFR
jgi:hypothetical protein